MISVSNTPESSDDRAAFHVALAGERAFHPPEVHSGLIALMRCNVLVGGPLVECVSWFSIAVLLI